jgi:hypothetical protein
MGRYQSGQLGQTVNLLANAFVGSNPALPTFNGGVCPELMIVTDDSGPLWTILGGSSSVGRALAFQAKGRGFEFRLPLTF